MPCGVRVPQICRCGHKIHTHTRARIERCIERAHSIEHAVLEDESAHTTNQQYPVNQPALLSC